MSRFLFQQEIKGDADTLPAVLNYFNFHPLEGVSHWRDPQLQVVEN